MKANKINERMASKKGEDKENPWIADARPGAWVRRSKAREEVMRFPKPHMQLHAG